MLVAKMMGKDFDDLADIKGDHKDKRITDAEPVIEAKGLSHKGTIKPFDITINKGEVIGLTGLLGSGRSEFVSAAIYSPVIIRYNFHHVHSAL